MCINDVFLPYPQVRVIPLELQRLFASLLLADQQSASTADLTDSFGWNSSEVCVYYLYQWEGEREAQVTILISVIYFNFQSYQDIHAEIHTNGF